MGTAAHLCGQQLVDPLLQEAIIAVTARRGGGVPRAGPPLGHLIGRIITSDGEARERSPPKKQLRRLLW
jgi:hypothetical protein